MIAAAWLHDVVEDTPATLGEVRNEFGEDVARLVDEVTNVAKPEDGNRAARKAMNRLHSAAASPDGQTVKLGDVISNLSTIGQADRAFAALFVGLPGPHAHPGRRRLSGEACRPDHGNTGVGRGG
jgi:(p)ppGpp synthase/HD superfamily hydrolase